jgi:mRNA-degrading endonuclease toxin of MazEF toxin-antitoxin module
LSRACAANCDSMSTIPKATLLSRIGPLSPTKLADVEPAIHFALGLST